MTQFSRVLKAAIFVTTVMLIGTIGYVMGEGAGWADAFWMVIITVSTVGYEEVFPLSDFGRIWTSVLIVLGVGGALYTAGAALDLAIERVTDRGRKNRMLREIDRVSDHHIVCGYGRVGEAVVEDILAAGADVVLVEQDAVKSDAARAAGILVVTGDATLNTSLEEAGIERAKSVVACVHTDSDNLVISLSAKSLNPNVTVVARANEAESVEKLTLAGADRVVAPQLVGGHRMAVMAMQAGLADVVELVLRGSRHLELRLERISIHPGAPLEGKTLRSAAIRELSGATIIGIEDAGQRVSLNPDPDRPLITGDVLVALGTPEQVAKLDALASRGR
ncbi:MAG: potassium channel protein [Acidimicrobiia bacterium]|nr:potassium channel protein [Acidimicrobiia bacterium]